MKKFDATRRFEEAKTASNIFMNPQMDADRDYFTLHPKDASYTRNPYPNELKQGILIHGRPPKKMEVFNVGNGLRFKKFIN